MRTALVEEARMRALETAIGGSRRGRAAGQRRVMAVLLAAALMLATAVAANAAAAPGGPLYGARIWLETAALPAGADARALERIRQIEERLVDAERATESGDPIALAAAIQAYRDAVANAVGEVGTDGDRLARLEATLGHHVTVLEALAGKVPEAAAGGIDRALEASQKAVEAIGRTNPTTHPNPNATDPNSEPTEKPGRTGRPETPGIP